ncbi:acetyl esterase/lipase [Pedobacter sp. UYEF25]
MKPYFFSLVILLSFLSLTSFAQQEIPLYEGAIPNSKPDTVTEKRGSWGGENYFLKHITKPTLIAFLPTSTNANGTEVVICPGGGYEVLAINNEGFEIAKAFQQMGIAAFVLKYRMPSDESMIDKNIGPLQDAQRAIQLIKINAKKWGVDTAKVGIAGFSAGGHLAATVGTHFQRSYILNAKKISFKPAFMILGYPVISFTDSLTHMGSRNNLIGKNPSATTINEYSNEMQVTKNTPPTFLVQADDDDVVKVENSIYFYLALHSKGVPAEMLLYPKGGHGYGLNNHTTTSKWMDECKKWLLSNGFIGR